MAYSPAGGEAPQNYHVPSQESPYDAASPPPPQRLPPPPPPKLLPDHEDEEIKRSHASNIYLPNDPHPQQTHPFETLNEGQRQYERFQVSQKDLITYSIPSSVWRQDPPVVEIQSLQPGPESRMGDEEIGRSYAELQREHRPMPPLSTKDRGQRTAASSRNEPQGSYGALADPDHTLGSDQSEQRGKGLHFHMVLKDEWERQAATTQNSTSAHQPHQRSHARAENVGWQDSENEQQRSDSFYWQSPHSSIHSTKDELGGQYPTATPLESIHGGQREPLPEPEGTGQDHNDMVPSTLLSHSILGSYSASALGFGGPSDWEHFGDYEAEDIDDTDLYTRPKSPVRARNLPKTAELPAESTRSIEYTIKNVQQMPEQVIGLETAQRSDGTAGQAMSEKRSGEALSQPPQLQSAVRDTATLEGKAREVVLDHGTAELSHAPPADIEVMSSASDAPNSDNINTDLDETIRAWSREGSTENLINTESVEHAPIKRGVASLYHKLEPTTNGTVQPEALLPPVADDTSPAQDASVESPPGDQPTNTKFASVPVEEVNHAHLGKPDEQQVSSAGPASCQPKPGEISEDQAAIAQVEPDLVDREASANQPTLAPTRGLSSKTQETDDPYAGLDAWGKASLNRYIAMLREESQADTDKEKLNIFTVFTTRETRLRAVLYDADLEQTNAPPIAVKAGPIVSPIKRASTTSYKRASKALPALPEDASDQDPPELNGHSRKPSKKLSAAAILGNPKPAVKALDTTSTSPADDAYVMVDSPNSVQYSPGGRPVVPRVPKANNLSKIAVDSQRIEVDAVNDSSIPEEPSNFPIPTSMDQPVNQNATAYLPLEYSAGRSEAQNYAANRLSKRQSVLRPYSKMMGSDECREIFSNGMASSEDVPKVSSNETLLASSSSADGNVELDLRRFERADFDPLLSVLPEAGEIRSESLQLSDLKDVMDSVPDDFTFIHQSVVAWDTKAKRQRDSNERQRHARQVESEQRIDALFDDHEIGYGDISELESGFKRSEAARKADEDRAEYQTFVSEVFNIVWTRLHYEIDQLAPHYQKYTEVLSSTTAGKDMFDPSSDRFALAPTMDSLLTLHQKLEIRHQKAFEAVLERDRRLKKTELSPWYSLGNVAKVKQLEKQFEVAEKKAILDYCRQRDIRANSLMDNLDQNTLRGVGANQDYMEMVMKAVRRIASGRAFASQPGSSEPGVGLEEVTKAKSITKALATSSEQIVQTFHVADMLLNAADYELSVAKARLEGADVAIFQNLKEERAKEDQKLMRDLEHRLALIREDSRRTHDEIVKLLLFLGVQSGHAEASSGAPKPADPRHEERLQKALEEAKRRNANKEPDATPPI